MSINLVENKTKYFFNSELKKCCEKSYKKKSLIVNLVLFFLFISAVSLFLLYMYQNKSDKPKNNDEKTRQYVLNKMRKFNKNEIKSDLITNLPIYSNDYNPRIL